MLEATLINDILMNGRDVMTTIYDFQAELLEGEQKKSGRLSRQGFIGGEYR